SYLFSERSCALLEPRSFPTRRSSDLVASADRALIGQQLAQCCAEPAVARVELDAAPAAHFALSAGWTTSRTRGSGLMWLQASPMARAASQILPTIPSRWIGPCPLTGSIVPHSLDKDLSDIWATSDPAAHRAPPPPLEALGGREARAEGEGARRLYQTLSSQVRGRVHGGVPGGCTGGVPPGRYTPGAHPRYRAPVHTSEPPPRRAQRGLWVILTRVRQHPSGAGRRPPA